jgi:hypothetical protein
LIAGFCGVAKSKDTAIEKSLRPFAGGVEFGLQLEAVSISSRLIVVGSVSDFLMACFKGVETVVSWIRGVLGRRLERAGGCQLGDANPGEQIKRFVLADPFPDSFPDLVAIGFATQLATSILKLSRVTPHAHSISGRGSTLSAISKHA